MVGEYSQLHPQPFTTYEGLYRRLNQLLRAGLINRRTMLFNGEYYFYLTRKGAGMLGAGSAGEIPTRAFHPVAETLQRHEFQIAQFWLKFLRDARKLNFEIVRFWRDGEFVFEVPGGNRTYTPDGGILLNTGERHRRLYLLELDRSTMMAMGRKLTTKSFRAKLEVYLKSRRAVLSHPSLNSEPVRSFRVLTVCPSDDRLRNLVAAAEHVGLRNLAAFTCWPRLTTVHDHTARGWRYKPDNIFTTPLFSLPNRSPPAALVPTNHHIT